MNSQGREEKIVHRDLSGRVQRRFQNLKGLEDENEDEDEDEFCPLQ